MVIFRIAYNRLIERSNCPIFQIAPVIPSQKVFSKEKPEANSMTVHYNLLDENLPVVV